MSIRHGITFFRHVNPGSKTSGDTNEIGTITSAIDLKWKRTFNARHLAKSSYVPRALKRRALVILRCAEGKNNILVAKRAAVFDHRRKS